MKEREKNNLLDVLPMSLLTVRISDDILHVFYLVLQFHAERRQLFAFLETIRYHRQDYYLSIKKDNDKGMFLGLA